MENNFKVQCCCCGRFKIGEDENDNSIYDDTEREIIRTGNVSHGYCKPCQQKEIEKMEKYIDDKKAIEVASNIRKSKNKICPECNNEWINEKCYEGYIEYDCPDCGHEWN